ncbi:MAG: GNAT family N-acetyltransferase [Paludibacter sp.]
MQAASSLEFLPVQAAAQVAEVARLARVIWSEHYLDIIGQAQIDYMLARFQSEPAIAGQIEAGDEYFLLRHDGTMVGYAAIRSQPETARLFVSKLYLLATARGRGWGRDTLAFLAQLAQQRGLSTLWLTVNKHNPALHAYLAVGFVQVAEVVADIGAGYVMDDYQLEWRLPAAAPV